MAQYETFNTLGMNRDEDSSVVEKVHNIVSNQDRENIIRHNKIVVIDNYTNWCRPCKQCATLFAALAKKYSKFPFIVFAKENVENNYEQMPIKIQGVPCFHFYVNGEFQHELTITGADINTVEKTVQKLISHFL